MPKEFRLFANVDYVKAGNEPWRMNLYCHVLLLEPGPSRPSGMPQGGQIRGFLTDGALPIFTLPLLCGHLDYKMRMAKSTHITMETEAGAKILHSGHNVTFDDDVALDIVIADPKRKLDISEYNTLDEALRALPHKALEYWQEPKMPVRSYLPVHLVPQYLDSMHA